MAVSIVAVGVRADVTAATTGSARRRGERLRAPESGWEVAVRPVIGVRVDVAPMAMGGSMTAGGVHGWQRYSALGRPASTFGVLQHPRPTCSSLSSWTRRRSRTALPEAPPFRGKE